jgi:hypothetical protein
MQGRFTDSNKIKDFVLFNLNHNSRGLLKVLHSEGFVSPRTQEEVLIATVNYIECDRENAIKKIIDNHPHYDFILQRAIETGLVKPTSKLEITNENTIERLSSDKGMENNNNTSRILKTETDSNGNSIITQELVKAKNSNKFLLILVFILIGIYLFKINN